MTANEKTAEEIVYRDLHEKLERLQKAFEQAQGHLLQRDFIECAMTLKSVETEIDFNNFSLGILNALSRKKEQFAEVREQ